MLLKKLFVATSLVWATLLTTACGGDPQVGPRNSDPAPTATATATPAPTSTATPAPSPSATPTATPVATPTPSPTATPTTTPTATPEPSPTPSAAPAKVAGPLDPVQEQIIDEVVVNQIGALLPAPLNGISACVGASLNHLTDIPDAILVGAEGLGAGADPFNAFNASALEVQAALERFAGSLQSSLLSLVDRGDCDPEDSSGAVAGNPLAGTPLAPIGAAIDDLLRSFPSADAEPNLNQLRTFVAPALSALGDAFDTLPAELSAAPVVGGMLTSLDNAITDIDSVLEAFGQYDSDGTAAATRTFISNLLSGLLLDSLPVAAIDPALAATMQTAINTLSSTLGNNLAQVIPPLFNEGLAGLADPLTEPTTGLLALILADGNPLNGILAGVAGDGSGSAVDALLGSLLTAINGPPLNNLLDAAGTPMNDASPLDLLGGLQDQIDVVDTLLGTVDDLNDNPSTSLDTILDTLLGSDEGEEGDGGLLGGLLG